jgi:hypothetical protein
MKEIPRSTRSKIGYGRSDGTHLSRRERSDEVRVGGERGASAFAPWAHGGMSR